jgi:hypothetical protein
VSSKNTRTSKQWAPRGPLLAIEIDLARKLHAVAPGEPPEGHCKKEQRLVDYTTFDDYFRTEASAIRLVATANLSPLGEVPK